MDEEEYKKEIEQLKKKIKSLKAENSDLRDGIRNMHEINDLDQNRFDF